MLDRMLQMEQNHPRICPTIYMLTSAFLLSICSLISKMHKEISVNEIVYYRGIIMVLVNSYFIMKYKIETYHFDKDTQQKLILRGIMGCFGIYTFYLSLRFINISEGLVIFRTSSIWTAIISVFYLKKDKCSIALVINLLLCMVGIILITQPSQLFGVQVNSDNHILGVIIMLTSAFLQTFVQVLIKSLEFKVNQLVILQYFSIITIIIPIVLIDKIQFLSYKQILDIIIIGITSYFSQLLMNRAYLKGRLIEMAMAGQTQVIFGFIFDLMSGATLSMLSILGTILIFGSILSQFIYK